MVDSNSQVASAALAWIEAELPGRASAIHGTVGQVSTMTDIEKVVRGAWMVVECIPEIKDAKVELLGLLDRLCEEDTIIATISSSYKSGDLLDKVSREGRVRVLKTHYYLPPEMPPVEIMSSGYTDPAIFSFLIAKLKEIDMDPVLVEKQFTGLIYGRVWAAMKRELIMVLADGVGTPADIDKLFRYCFSSQGAPCALMDNVGLQAVCNIEDNYIAERGYIPRYPVDYIRQNYVDKGNLGSMTGKGLFDHGKASQTPTRGQKVSLRSQLIGAWELVEHSGHKERNTHDKVYPMGEDAKGTIMFTSNGYMSAQLQKLGTPKVQDNDLNSGAKVEWQAAGENHIAYTGPYFLDEGSEVAILQHHVTSSILPNWLHDIQRRTVNITEQGAEKYLTLRPESVTTVMGEMRLIQENWRRLYDNHALVQASS